MLHRVVRPLVRGLGLVADESMAVCRGTAYLPSTSSAPTIAIRRRWLHTTHARLASQAKFDELMEEERRRRRPTTVGSGTSRKRRAVTSHFPQTRSPQVVSLAIAESLDLHGLVNDPSLTNLYTATFIDDEFDHAIHLVKRLQYTIDPSSILEAFVFSDGVVVFWNVDTAERAQVLRDLEKHAVGLYESATAHSELDTLPFSVEGQGRSHIAGEKIVLEATKHGEAKHHRHGAVLERFAFSHAFAASVKLGVWEALLNSKAEPLANTTKELKSGRVPWSRREALRQAGEFADLRHAINLNCSLLDRDIYWERTNLETFYDTTLRHLTVERRLRLLNSRLDYCEEIVRMVDGMLSVRHSATLEWMIIVLIVIEVFFDVFHFWESFEPTRVVVVNEAPKDPEANS